MRSLDRTPIFVLGMLQRTGTNHLWDLFGLHPDTELLVPVFEDHLLRCSDPLVSYVAEVERFWSPEWDVPASEAADLLAALGDGILSWVQGDSDRRVVTKMPSVERAERFFDLFPGCPLVLLIRDGRSVCESGVKSFGWSYERAFRRWAAAADIVLEVLNRFSDDPRVVLVRYEDLVDDEAAAMRRLCAAVGLDAERYPYELIEALPVRGSSTLRTQAGSEIHWTPIERTSSFDPRRRFAEWDEHRHRRFAEVAGAQQRALGYECADVPGSSSVADWVSDRKDLLLDARYREARVRLGRVKRAARHAWGDGA